MSTPDGLERWNLFVLADQRGLEVWELEEYPASYLNEWFAYLEKSNAPPKKDD